MTREEAIDILTKNLKCERAADDCNLMCANCNLFVKSDLVVDASVLALEALESQKVGKWLKNPNGGLLSWYCSECSTPTAMGTMQYCYHCGAKMEVESETSDRYTRSNVSALQESMARKNGFCTRVL